MRQLGPGFRLAAGGLAVAAALSGCSSGQDRPAETGSPVTATPTQKAVPSLSPNGPQSIAPNGSAPRPASPLPGKGPDSGQ